MNRRLRITGVLFSGLLGLVASAAYAQNADQHGIDLACSSEADRLGLHGPERFDFRAKCKGRGLTFLRKPMSDHCRQVIIENGISGRAFERMKVLRGTGAAAEVCQQLSLLKAA